MIDLKVLNKHTYVSGTMTCKSCKTLIVLKGKLSKAQMKGLCRRRCDGTLRGRDGLPTDPVIRQQVIEQSQEKKRITLERRKAKRRARLAKQKKRAAQKPDFLSSPEWRLLRYKALLQYGRRCQCCRTTQGVMHVDHIRPRSRFPELALEISNLQILCEACNLGKGAWDQTDWRDKPEL